MDALSYIQIESLESEKTKQARMMPKKILVVEDDTTMTVLLGKAILDVFSDAEIQWATSLEQAVTQLIQNTDIAEKIPYDLIIADIFLEGNGTGLDLWKVLSRTYPTIPFMVISSISEEQVLSAVTEEQRRALVYLKKPFQYIQCKDSIKNILSGK